MYFHLIYRALIIIKLLVVFKRTRWKRSSDVHINSNKTYQGYKKMRESREIQRKTNWIFVFCYGFVSLFMSFICFVKKENTKCFLYSVIKNLYSRAIQILLQIVCKPASFTVAIPFNCHIYFVIMLVNIHLFIIIIVFTSILTYQTRILNEFQVPQQLLNLV